MIASVPVNGRLLELAARVAVAAGDVLADGELPDVVAPRTRPADGVLEPVVVLDGDEPLVVLSPRTWLVPGAVVCCVAGAAVWVVGAPGCVSVGGVDGCWLCDCCPVGQPPSGAGMMSRPS